MELLAPAGNMECLKAAVNCGADAVYFAGKSFGARSFADNFSHEELCEAIAYCHLRGVKCYITVNTMTLDREINELVDFITVLANSGADGVIVQDLGVAEVVKKVCPDMEIHGSTQMTIHNLDGVLAAKNSGMSRVVLSRELSKENIKYITENCGIEIEVFVHGAMCMSYSGQCLMSSVLGGRSGNRGKCAQPCRLKYHKDGGRDAFYLSLKDMSLINHIKELRDMKIASLKIEGRMKGPEYVSAVVSTYRRCIDSMEKPTQIEIEKMNRIFYRGGLTDGYFINKKGKEMFAFDKPDNPYAKNGGIDKIDVLEKKNKIKATVLLKEDEPSALTIEYGDIVVKVLGEHSLERALRSRISEEDVVNRISKTGGTVFEMESVLVDISGNPFVSVGELNGLRRKALNLLEKEILAKYVKSVTSNNSFSDKVKRVENKLQYTATVRTLEQFKAIADADFKWIGVPIDIILQNQDYFVKYNDKVVVCPPVIVPDNEKDKLENNLKNLFNCGFKKLLAENICWFENKQFEILGGHRLNVANSIAVNKYHQMGVKSLCVSIEINKAQIRDLDKTADIEMIIYGHIPLMITENCILKNVRSCPCNGAGEIVDRKGEKFPVVKDGESCRSVVLNTVPMYLGDKAEEIEKYGVAYGRAMFTIETPERCVEICKRIFSERILTEDFTRLHFSKGVD